MFVFWELKQVLWVVSNVLVSPVPTWIVGTIILLELSVSRQLELKDLWCLVWQKFNYKDLWLVRILLKDESIPWDVPVADSLSKRALKHHSAFCVPDLQQVLFATKQLLHLLVYDSYKHRAKVALFSVLAACNEFVELVKRDLEHDFCEELLWVAKLVLLVAQAPLFVDFFNFLSVYLIDWCAKHSFVPIFRLLSCII